jgi:hypothetical protein
MINGILKIIILCNSANIGDMSHQAGLIDGFNTAVLDSKIQAVEFVYLDAGKTDVIDDLSNQLSIQETAPQDNILLIVGESAVRLFAQNHDKIHITKKVMKVASVHQYFPEIKTLSDTQMLDYIAIPKAAIENEEKYLVINSIKNKTLTIGVPSKNPSISELEKKYNEWEIINKPAIDENYVIVMLPGDAPDETGRIINFNEDSCRQLAQFVIKLLESKDYSVIVENGPRTGKYTVNPPQSAHVHVKGEDPENSVDEISKIFLNELKARGIEPLFYNFTFEIDPEATSPVKIPNSVYSQLLYVAHKNPNNIFILPGESVSALSQTPLYINPENIIVFKPSSMNSQHEAIFSSIFDRGYLSYFDESGNVIYPVSREHMTHDIKDEVVNDIIGAYIEFDSN